MGGSFQAALRRTAASSEVSGPLYAPGGPLQQPHRFDGRRPCHVSVEGLRGRQPNQGHDPGRGRVHPALSSAYSAHGTAAHPSVWFPGEPGTRKETCALPRAARSDDCPAGPCRGAAPTQTMSGLQDRPSDSGRRRSFTPTASAGLVVKLQPREIGGPRALSLEARGDLRPRHSFCHANIHTRPSKRGRPVAMYQDPGSRESLPPPISCSECGTRNQNHIQSP